MRRLLSAAALVAIFMVVVPAPCKAPKRASSAIEIVRPTVIAFFPSDPNAVKNDDANDSLFDFQLYTASARQRLAAENVEFQVVYTRSFQVVQDGRLTNFRPPRAEAGYYFAMPGKKPRVEYGVMSDKDIERVAGEYFGGAVKR
jgi:hypothetical protein